MKSLKKINSLVVRTLDIRPSQLLSGLSTSFQGPFVATSTLTPPQGVGLPVFVVEPEDVYHVVRGGGPVVLTCGAWPAIQITVQCAGKWIDPSRQVTGEMVDSRSGTRYLGTSVELSKNEVDQLTASQNSGGLAAAASGSVGGGSPLGGDTDYQCECHAWNNVPTFQSARSKKISVRLACQYNHNSYKNTRAPNGSRVAIV